MNLFLRDSSLVFDFDLPPEMSAGVEKTASINLSPTTTLPHCHLARCTAAKPIRLRAAPFLDVYGSSGSANGFSANPPSAANAKAPRYNGANWP